jgi:drug/metabolite transporter (DMT)-like permease
MAPKNNTLTGIAFMLAAMAILPIMDVFAKMFGQMGVPILQVVWARLTFGALTALPFALQASGRSALRPERPFYHFFRATFLAMATFSFFTSLKYLPMADALAIFFVQPFIVVILSALFLGEKIGPRRVAAVMVGFAGTLIIIRPGFGGLSLGTGLALAAGVFLAIYFVMTRHISGKAKAVVTTFQTSAIGALTLSLICPFVWIAPTLDQWLMFAGLGAIATFGHFLIVRAYDYAEASLLAPLAFTEIIGAIILGWVFFKDFPDRFTLLGVGILIASAIYISWRERQVAGA